jgi:hypothetical protein
LLLILGARIADPDMCLLSLLRSFSWALRCLSYTSLLILVSQALEGKGIWVLAESWNLSLPLLAYAQGGKAFWRWSDFLTGQVFSQQEQLAMQ